MTENERGKTVKASRPQMVGNGSASCLLENEAESIRSSIKGLEVNLHAVISPFESARPGCSDLWNHHRKKQGTWKTPK